MRLLVGAYKGLGFRVFDLGRSVESRGLNCIVVLDRAVRLECMYDASATPNYLRQA